MLSVIGIHSSAIGASSSQVGNKFVDGHAWLSLHYTNGRHTTVGLWAEGELVAWNHVIRDPLGLSPKTAEKFEVRFGEEEKRGYRPKASRYYGLYNTQSSYAIMHIGKYTGWRATHTCATWATEKIKEIFGLQLASTEFFGLTNTPRALGAVIARLDTIDPTSIQKPKYVSTA
jgi:hypothetical protein